MVSRRMAAAPKEMAGTLEFLEAAYAWHLPQDE
jgi:hypothetical protein